MCAKRGKNMFIYVCICILKKKFYFPLTEFSFSWPPSLRDLNYTLTIYIDLSEHEL